MASASDDFNRVDGGLGVNWTSVANAHQIVSNQVTGNPAAAWCLSVYSGVSWTGNHRVSATMPGSADWGLAARVQDANNFITVAGQSATEFAVVQYLAGSGTVLANPVTYSAGQVALEVSGALVRVYVEGVLAGEWTTTVLGSGSPGLYSNTTAMDNWSAADILPMMPMSRFAHHIRRDVYRSRPV
jgi:hypothetical protein